MNGAPGLLPPDGPMDRQSSVRPEPDQRLRFLQALDDVAALVEEARAVLVQHGWAERQALEYIARALTMLVEALEDWAGRPSTTERDMFRSVREEHPEEHR